MRIHHCGPVIPIRSRAVVCQAITFPIAGIFARIGILDEILHLLLSPIIEFLDPALHTCFNVLFARNCANVFYAEASVHKHSGTEHIGQFALLQILEHKVLLAFWVSLVEVAFNNNGVGDFFFFALFYDRELLPPPIKRAFGAHRVLEHPSQAVRCRVRGPAVRCIIFVEEHLRRYPFAFFNPVRETGIGEHLRVIESVFV